MNENIMNNEEIIVEAIEEATVGTGNVGKIFGIAAGVTVGAVALYKVGKWAVAKIKDKKAQRKADAGKDEMIVDESDLVVDDCEEE